MADIGSRWQALVPTFASNGSLDQFLSAGSVGS